jgi:2-C-methyl-D-erythritol 4-phosphate cytidylyltransferase
VARRGVAVTDDAAAVELLGQAITLEENPHPNPKLTTPADFAYVEFLLAREAAAADISPS